MSRPTSAIKLGAALLAIPLLTACLGTGAPPAQNKPSTQGAPSGQRQIAVPVNLASVNRGNIASTLTYSGNIQSRERQRAAAGDGAHRTAQRGRRQPREGRRHD